MARTRNQQRYIDIMGNDYQSAAYHIIGDLDQIIKNQSSALTSYQIELPRIIKKLSEKGNLYVGSGLDRKMLIKNAQLAGYRYALADVLKKLKEIL